MSRRHRFMIVIAVLAVLYSMVARFHEYRAGLRALHHDVSTVIEQKIGGRYGDVE